MTDPDPAPDAPLPAALPQITVDPSAIRTLLLMLIRVIGIVVTAFGTIIGLVKAHNLVGLINWIKSDNFITTLSAIGLLGTFGASTWVTLSRKWREVYLAHWAPNRIAVVKPPSIPPSVEATPVAPTPPAA